MMPSRTSFSSRSSKKVKLSPECISELQAKMFELSTKCILDTRFKSIQASAIATAIVYYVRRLHHISPMWSERLTNLTFHDPKMSQSVMKALYLILEMEKPADDETNATSRLLAPSDFLEDEEEEEEEEDTLEGEDTLESGEVDGLELDDCDQEEEEETDLVQALHKALFIDQATPSKSTANNGDTAPLITPMVPQKNFTKGMLDSDLSPVAISEFVSP